MRLFLDVMWLLRVVAGQRTRSGGSGPAGGTGMDRGELAKAMRRLAGRYAGRLPERTLDRVAAAAAAGRWERAVGALIAALRARAAMITAEERDELRRVLEAMDLSSARVEKLAVRPTLRGVFNARLLRRSERQPPAG